MKKNKIWLSGFFSGLNSKKNTNKNSKVLSSSKKEYSVITYNEAGTAVFSLNDKKLSKEEAIKLRNKYNRKNKSNPSIITKNWGFK